MKPAPFRYERADSLRGALEFLDAEGVGAKPLAGGQSLVALMNLRLSRPDAVLDLGPLDELRFHNVTDDAVEVGALTTQAALEADDAVARSCPLLAEALPHIGHAAIRNRGTIGGSVAHADPAAELPVVLAALGGRVTLRSLGGERSLDAGEFFRGFLQTAAEPSEIVTSVTFPGGGAGSGAAFEEFARRPGDFALVSVAAIVHGNGGGEAIGAARLALGGVATVPIVVEGTDELGGLAAGDAAERAAELADAAVDPVGDIHGSAEYRRHLTRELVKRAIARAAGASGEDE